MTAPLVPADVDLRDFAYMPLDVQRLRDSQFTATVKPEEFRAGLLLWCAAWHQVPAGSLPDDDMQLAKLAGYGYGLKDWRKVKHGALYGWTKCSDGRLHHKIAAEKALESWESKLKHGHNRYTDRMRKENKRRKELTQSELPILAFDEWKTAGRPEEFRQNGPPIPAESAADSAGITPENPLKGSGSEFKGSKTVKVGVTPTDSARPAGNGHFAIENTGNSSPPGFRTIAEAWQSTPQSVAATAETVNCPRHEGEAYNAWKDRVYSAVEELKRQSQREAVRKKIASDKAQGTSP